ncbi:MAG TPA: 7-cyano-7-deazaguanine synthase QueC [Candidatus Binatia bacterium]|nr:7-cyano-7-deazaguanine synthase QueC [Candidatus Binatia bacterium]
MNKGAIVLFSGGIDSTTALYWARRRFDWVRALIVDYGQRHRIEVEMAKKIAAGLGVVHDVVTLPLQNLLHSALLADGRAIPESLAAARNEPGTPSTYVPFRNGIFLSLAAASAESCGCRHLVTGFNAVDSPDYPDTTALFSRKMAAAINQGTSAAKGQEKFEVHTPLIALSKQEIITLGFELGADYAYSISCYRGAEQPCGRCPSCDIRARAFAGLGRRDPLLARLHKEGKA